MSAYEFTPMQSAESGIAAKTATRAADGAISWKPYDHVTRWWMRPCTAVSHEAMAQKLGFYSGRPELMIVAGAPILGLDLSKTQLRRSNNNNPSTNTLMGAPRGWLAIDCDDVSVPDGLGAGDRLPEAAEFVRDSLLSPEFCGIEMVAAATASTGLQGPGIARLRLFSRLDREFPLSRLHDWAKAARIADIPVDPAVLLPSQPIYTARPIFKNMNDPVPVEFRAFILPGPIDDRVPLVIDRYDAKAAAVEQRVRQAALSCGADWRALLDQLVGGPEGFFEPLKRGLGLAARSVAMEQEIVIFIAALLAARADRGRQAAYGSTWVLQAIRNFRASDRRTDAEIAALRDQLIRK